MGTSLGFKEVVVNFMLQGGKLFFQCFFLSQDGDVHNEGLGDNGEELCVFVFYGYWVVMQIFLVVLGRRWMVEDNIASKEKFENFMTR